MRYRIAIAIVAIVVIVGSISAYAYLQSVSQTTPSNNPTPITLNGAGATFPYPLLSVMNSHYHEQNTSVSINYQPIGSGGGISDLENKLVDFAASDAPLGPADIAKANSSLHIPETIGAVTIAYNLPGIATGLHLTGKVIADIFDGNVTMWNDAEIQNLNSNVTLPAKSIFPVHRSDGSGTTFIFTGYLSVSSSVWNQTIGQGKTVAWPGGSLGASGNAGVAQDVNNTQYTIGYVELAYALQNAMTVAAVQNPTGNWILPSLNTIQLAVQTAASSGLPAGNQSWTNVSLLNANDSEAYPIVSFTYLLVYQELNVVPGMTQARATALVQYLWWVVQPNGGQQYSTSLEYVPLPANVVQIDEATIQSITFNEQHLPTS
ncbi:MAG: phosphate ABC transporter substrate-binding protein PstS [Candidatus Bathyarchaeia archaeon]|jgi:phosphate ABC transporter phosphate-binding protein